MINHIRTSIVVKLLFSVLLVSSVGMAQPAATALQANGCSTGLVVIERLDVSGDATEAEILPFLEAETGSCFSRDELDSYVSDLQLRLKKCGLFSNIQVALGKGIVPQSYLLEVKVERADQRYVGVVTGYETSSPLFKTSGNTSAFSAFRYGAYVGHRRLPGLHTAVDFSATQTLQQSRLNNGQKNPSGTATNLFALNLSQPALFKDNFFGTLGLYHMRNSNYQSNPRYNVGGLNIDVPEIDPDASLNVDYAVATFGLRRDFWVLSPQYHWGRIKNVVRRSSDGKNIVVGRSHEYYREAGVLFALRNKLLVDPMEEGIYTGIYLGSIYGSKSSSLGESRVFAEYSKLIAPDLLFTPGAEFNRTEGYEVSDITQKYKLHFDYQFERDWILNLDLRAEIQNDPNYAKIAKFAGVGVKYLNSRLNFEFNLTTGTESSREFYGDPRRVTE